MGISNYKWPPTGRVTRTKMSGSLIFQRRSHLRTSWTQFKKTASYLLHSTTETNFHTRVSMDLWRTLLGVRSRNNWRWSGSHPESIISSAIWSLKRLTVTHLCCQMAKALIIRKIRRNSFLIIWRNQGPLLTVNQDQLRGRTQAQMTFRTLIQRRTKTFKTSLSCRIIWCQFLWTKSTWETSGKRWLATQPKWTMSRWSLWKESTLGSVSRTKRRK